MTEVEPVKTVTLNDTQYNVDDMSERGQYIVAQLGEIQQESQGHSRAPLPQSRPTRRGGLAP